MSPHPASFRDPDGFVYNEAGTLYRYVAPSGKAGLERLVSSGLYDTLVEAGLLVAHIDRGPTEEGGCVLQPERLPFIAHPYEWCFGQLKAAAKTTLALQRSALAHNLSLKDASAFNIAFRGARPLLFDTLSFAPYHEGEPWAAYRQFCQHFLAPLALMSRCDIRLAGLLRTYLDGIPLDLASRLLPRSTRLSPGLAMHIHLHAKAQQAGGEGDVAKPRTVTVSKNGLLGLLDSLESTIDSLRWEPGGTVWADYYEATNYTDAALLAKEQLVGELLDAITPSPALAWDLGANTGRFSRLASQRGAFTVAWDFDPAAVELGWRDVIQHDERNLLPLTLDLMNPSPRCGWAETERESLLDRGPADVVLALALVHHLALANNTPLPRILAFLAKAGRQVIVEFVPKSDSQVKRLLAHRPDIFPSYTQAGFEAALAPHFNCLRRAPVPGTERTLYLLKAKNQ